MKIKSALLLTVGLSFALVAAWLLTFSGFSISGVRAASLTVCSTGCDYSVIQDAVDAAGEGDVIKVATGTYDDVNNYNGLAQVVYINKTVTIRGGYTPAFTEPPDPVANPTTLDAGGQGIVIYIEGNVSPTIEGLRITGGDASVLETIYGGPKTGGGVQIYDAAVTFRDNQIFNNTAYDGGGMRLDNSAATLKDNHIFSNTADNGGGGLFLSLSPATLSGNNISENVAGSYGGGGMFIENSAATINNNTIISNTAVESGGVCIAESDNLKFYANSVLSNTASESAGGLGCRISENVRISGNTFSYNTAPYAGGLNIGCTGTLNGNLISYNTANQGGGLGVCDILVEGNMIMGNSATEGAGGVFLWECAETILKANNIFENTAGWGAGVQMGFGEYSLINNVIADNQGGGGSGIHTENTTVYMLHNTLVRNHGADSTAIYVGEGTIALTNTIIVSNTLGIQVHPGGIATIESTLWGDGIWANGTDWTGDGTINHSNDYWGDPDFVDYLAGDYHIGESSYAKDNGIDAGVTTDIDFHPRPYQIPDIGADEYWPPGALKFIYLSLVLR